LGCSTNEQTQEFTRYPYRYSSGNNAKSCYEYFNAPGYASEGSGLYWIDPDGEGLGSAAFKAYCDMVNDGGGWTLSVVIEAANANHVNSAAVGTLTSPAQGTAAKLADDVINDILAAGKEKIIRFTCNGLSDVLDLADLNWCSGCQNCSNYHMKGWNSYSDYLSNTYAVGATCGSDEGGGLYGAGGNAMNYRAGAGNGCYQSGSGRAGTLWAR
jgi:hypothetical protein